MSQETKRKSLIKRATDRFRKYLMSGTLPTGFTYGSGPFVEGITLVNTGGPDDAHKKATIRYAYAAYPYGAWRDIDISEIRLLSNSVWVKRCKDLIINTITAHDYEIVSRDDKKYPELQKDIEDFFEYNTGSDEASGFIGLIKQITDDLLDISTMATVKSFSNKYYEPVDILAHYGFPQSHVSDHVFNQDVLKNDTPRGKTNGNYPLIEMKAYDSYTFLKQLSIYGDTLGYWQHGYSLVPPRFFTDREVAYLIQSPLSYMPYGVGQTQSITEIVKILIHSSTHTKGYFEKGAVPQGVLALDFAQEEYEAFVSEWKNKIEGQRYRTPIVRLGENGLKWIPFNLDQKDVMFLDGTDFYQKLVFSIYQVPPSELGYTDQVNKATSDNQSTNFKRKTVKPLMQLLAKVFNREIVLEFDPDRFVEFKWIYKPDIDELVKETAMYKDQVEVGLTTINERRKEEGRDDVFWGEVPPSLFSQGIIDEDGFNQREEERQETVAQMGEETPEEEDNPKEEEKEEEKGVQELISKFIEVIDNLKPSEKTASVQPIALEVNKAEEVDDDPFKGRAEQIKETINVKFSRELENIFYEYITDIIKTLNELPANFFDSVGPLKSAEFIADLFNDDVLAEKLLPIIARAYQYGILTIDEETSVDKGLFDNLKFITNYAKITASKFVGNFKEKIKFFVHDQSTKLQGQAIIVSGVKEMIAQFSKNLVPVSAITISQTAVNYGRLNQIQTKGYTSWVFYTMEDERVCPICKPHHDKVYSVNDLSFKPPLHPQCRCLAMATGQQPISDFLAQQQIMDDFAQDIQPIGLIAPEIRPIELGIRPAVLEMTKSMIIIELKGNNSLNQLLHNHLVNERKSTREIGEIYGLSHASIQNFIKECKLEHLL